MLLSFISRAASAIVFVVCALAITSCGGGRDSDASAGISTIDAAGRFTVQSPDGASVSFVPLGNNATPSESAPTVRVARDASGAQTIPEDYFPVGSVYQYTPLGMGAAKIEIRVPFDAALTGGQTPQLLVAMPGQPWQEVADTRIDAGHLVAQVPQLMYAVVATSNANLALAKQTGDTQSAAAKFAPSTPRLTLTVAPSTTPQLPAADARGIVNLTQATRLDLQLGYNLPAG
jgi:hypothetical protein